MESIFERDTDSENLHCFEKKPTHGKWKMDLFSNRIRFSFENRSTRTTIPFTLKSASWVWKWRFVSKRAIEFGPRVNNNGCQDWYNAPVQENHSVVKINSSQFPRIFKPITVWIAGQIALWITKTSRTSMIGSSFQSSLATLYIRCSFIWFLLSFYDDPMFHPMFRPVSSVGRVLASHADVLRSSSRTSAWEAGRVPDYWAGDRGFKLRPDHHSGSLNNWGESAAFVMTWSANG